MKKEKLWLLGVVFGVIIVFFILSLGIPKGEVSFCRNIFKGLTEGRQSIQKSIDWENLKALGLDIGATYNQLPDAKEKQDYRREFIKNLSASFRGAGARFAAFSNWRKYKHSGIDTIIAADYQAKARTILFVFSGYGNKKLTAILWEK